MDRPALPALLLLLVFFFVIRTVGERWLPVEQPLDCDRIAVADTMTLERCLEFRAGDVELMVDLGEAYERAAQWERAEAIYRRALAVDPEDGDIRVRLAHLLLRRGDADGAQREGASALAVQPGRAAALDVIRLATAAGARP